MDAIKNLLHKRRANKQGDYMNPDEFMKTIVEELRPKETLKPTNEKDLHFLFELFRSDSFSNKVSARYSHYHIEEGKRAKLTEILKEMDEHQKDLEEEDFK